MGQKEKVRPSRNYGGSKCGEEGGLKPDPPNPGMVAGHKKFPLT